MYLPYYVIWKKSTKNDKISDSKSLIIKQLELVHA